ncbi:unnamed protein product [Macrosiphum euphorbiae]|nr:unnamed protein product [Macrosiphum euphorbiae]
MAVVRVGTDTTPFTDKELIKNFNSVKDLVQINLNLTLQSGSAPCGFDTNTNLSKWTSIIDYIKKTSMRGVHNSVKKKFSLTDPCSSENEENMLKAKYKLYVNYNGSSFDIELNISMVYIGGYQRYQICPGSSSLNNNLKNKQEIIFSTTYHSRMFHKIMVVYKSSWNGYLVIEVFPTIVTVVIYPPSGKAIYEDYELEFFILEVFQDIEDICATFK